MAKQLCYACMAKQLCYRKLQPKNIRNLLERNLFVQACNLATYFKADDVMKHTRKNIVYVIDRGMFHNYVHVHKQLFCVHNQKLL